MKLSNFIWTAFILILCSCKKSINETTKNLYNRKVVTGNTVLSSIRFKNQIFTSNQLFIQNDILYRDSILDFSPGDSIHRNLKLDLYMPSSAHDTMSKRPLIIWIHGGGFVEGDKMFDTEACIDFAKYGYVVASINYRLNPFLISKKQNNTLTAKEIFETIYRAIQDARFAVRFSKKNSNAIAAKVDTNRIFVAGLSAGEVTALHVAYLDDDEISLPNIDQSILGQLDFGGASFGTSSKIAAVISFSGGLTDLEVIHSGNIPAICLHSTGDNMLSIDCGLDGPFKLITTCGGRVIANKLNSLNIPNAFKQFNDPYSPSPPATLTHGSVVKIPNDPTNGQLNPVGVQFTMDNLFYGYFQ